MSVPASATVLALLFALAAASVSAASSSSDERLKGDSRLQPTLTVRVGRMPLSDLLRRLDTELGVRLAAEGEDVADQKIDLFTNGEPASAAEILTALVDLLNAEAPPRSYRWDRSGSPPNYRYSLVRDAASRKWEARRGAEAEQRLVRLLLDKLVSLGNTPFRTDPARPGELPSMRRLLATLSEAQVARLISERLLVLTPGEGNPRQRSVVRLLAEEMTGTPAGRYAKSLEELGGAGWSFKEPDAVKSVYIYLLGAPPELRVEIQVLCSLQLHGRRIRLGQTSEVCQVVETVAITGARPPEPVRLAERSAEPVFALAPRTSWLEPIGRTFERSDNVPPVPRSSWLMGDVLADIAARAHLNLIADDYTQIWFHAPPASAMVSGFPEPGPATQRAMMQLDRYRGALPLSGWLAAIRDLYGFEAVREGKFLRVRNRRWYLDRRQEIPSRLLSRWGSLTRGSAGQRFQAAVETAAWAPLTSDPRPLYELLRPLTLSPELAMLADPGSSVSFPFSETVARVQPELWVYRQLSLSQQRAVTGEGLDLPWAEMTPAIRELFARRVRLWLEPGVTEEDLLISSLYLRFREDRIQVKWRLAGGPPAPGTEGRRSSFPDHQTQESLAPAPAPHLEKLIGRSLPDLHVEAVPGKSAPFRPAGPILLYIAPAWPRPVVTRGPAFPDLQALQQMADKGRRIAVVGTDATTAELTGWWRKRGLMLPPQVLIPESSQLLLRYQPLALVLDRAGRVVWVKEGYASGDEAQWEQQLESVGG